MRQRFLATSIRLGKDYIFLSFEIILTCDDDILRQVSGQVWVTFFYFLNNFDVPRQCLATSIGLGKGYIFFSFEIILTCDSVFLRQVSG